MKSRTEYVRREWVKDLRRQIVTHRRFKRLDTKSRDGTSAYRLREAGYHLGHIGKWHATYLRTPLDCGYHEAAGLIANG